MNRLKNYPWLGPLVNTALAALAFGLLGRVIWQNRETIREVFSRPLDVKFLAVALAVYFTAMICTFVRWYILVRVIEPGFKFSATLLLGFIGMVFNLVIPGAVGGDLIKASYLVRMRIRRTQAVASMVIDRILGLLGLFILSAIAGGFAWQLAPTDVRELIMAAWFAVGLGILVLVMIFSRVMTRLFPQLGGGHSRLGLIVSELRAMSTTYSGRLDVVLGAAGLSIFAHGLNVVAFYLVSLMLFPKLTTTLVEHFVMVPLILFSTAVPLPFGALGLAEEVGQKLLTLVRHPSGALAVMGFRVLMYVGGLVGACVYVWNLKEVRGLTASAHQIEEELLEGNLDEDEEASDT